MVKINRFDMGAFRCDRHLRRPSLTVSIPIHEPRERGACAAPRSGSSYLTVTFAQSCGTPPPGGGQPLAQENVYTRPCTDVFTRTGAVWIPDMMGVPLFSAIRAALA